MPLTMIVKWAMQALTAGSPATDPITAETTGTLRSRSVSKVDHMLPSGR